MYEDRNQCYDDVCPWFIFCSTIILTFLASISSLVYGVIQNVLNYILAGVVLFILDITLMVFIIYCNLCRRQGGENLI